LWSAWAVQEAALTWAAHEASLRGVAVHVVMAWRWPMQYRSTNVFGLGTDPSFDIKKSLAAAAAEETTRLGEETRKERDVPIAWETIEGHPARALSRGQLTASLHGSDRH
jgi:hypothetical protein